MFSKVKHTLNIFKNIYNNLPPLVPEEIKEEIEHALDHLSDDYEVGIEEAENMLISLGKKVWPYWKAFFELYNMEQGKLGEKFLLGRLSVELKQKYKDFKEHGGTYHDLRTGGPIIFFESEERQVLMEVLVEVDIDLQRHTKQVVTGLEKQKYEKLILDFQTIFDDIEKRLESLRLVAEDEEEHPELAREIRQRVRDFEYGLCWLGTNTRSHELENVEDYFEERRMSKKDLRL